MGSVSSAMTISLTFANFPGPDSAGHGTGRGGAYDEAVRQFDVELRRFVDQQKQLGLWERTVMLVISDHSIESTPGKTSLAQRFGAAGIPSSSYKIAQNGSAELVYLADRTDPGRFELLKRRRAEAIEGDAGPAAGTAGRRGDLPRAEPA